MSQRDQILKYILYGDDRLSGKLDTISAAGTRTDKVLGGVFNKANGLQNALGGAAGNLPGFGRGLSMMAGTAMLAGTALTTLAAGLNNAKNQAAEFNNEFRQLVNLNLDKTDFQRDNLKDSVLKTSYSGGFDPMLTSKGFYDVQSITGEYGAVVSSIVSQAGTFARVMQADFTSSVAGAAQAMRIYGFRVNQVQEYLASMYKTVMIGKTTFDELARVQVEYAGAAAAVGQSFDQANKIFSAFSITQKNVNIAAEKTKTAFEDLTKKPTLDGVAKLGVQIFDMGGNMRGVGDILEDLVPKLKGMNDIEFARFKEEIGGSEGLRGLLDMARNSADALLVSFRQFDNTEFDSMKAYEKALEDVTFLNDELSNRLKSSWVELGDSILPAWTKLKVLSIGVLDHTRQLITDLGMAWDMMFNLPQAAADQGVQYASVLGSRADAARTKYGQAVTDINSKTPLAEVDFLSKQIAGDMSKALEKSRSKGSETLRQAYKNQYDVLRGLFDQIGSQLLIEPTGTTNPEGDAAGGTGGVYGKDITAVAGGGQAVRNVSVVIQKLVESLNINTTHLSESSAEVEQKMTETLVRAVAGSEQILSN